MWRNLIRRTSSRRCSRRKNNLAGHHGQRNEVESSVAPNPFKKPKKEQRAPKVRRALFFLRLKRTRLAGASAFYSSQPTFRYTCARGEFAPTPTSGVKFTMVAGVGFHFMLGPTMNS